MPVQKAALAALHGPRGYVAEMVEQLKQRRDYSLKRINEIDGLSCAKPAGAFYLFPKVINLEKHWKDDTQFVLDVLRTEKVLFVPGSGFGNVYGNGHFRVVFLPPMTALQTAFDRLDHFMSNKRAR